MPKIEDYETRGVDIVFTEKIIVQADAPVIAVIVRQALTALARQMIYTYQPGMEFLSGTPPDHTDTCMVDGSHAHAGIEFKVVPKELAGILKDADDSA